MCTGGPIGAVSRIDDRWGRRRVEYRGRRWGGEWVERILGGRASAVGLLQWPVIRVWLSIIWIRGSGAGGVWQVAVIVMSVLGLISLTKVGLKWLTERKKGINKPLGNETWKKERMALVKDCVLFCGWERREAVHQQTARRDPRKGYDYIITVPAPRQQEPCAAPQYDHDRVYSTATSYT